MERVLNAGGFRALTFSSAEELLQAGTAASAACLVLDIHLPGLSGFELSRQLARAGARQPIIFMTAHDAPAARAEAVRLGASAYLAKPFQGRALLAAVTGAIGSP